MRRLVCAVLWTSCGMLLLAGDWPQFRGPHGIGIAPPGTQVPASWDAERNVKWKAPLPAGSNSSPIVVGDKVFVACPSADAKVRQLICFDRATGAQKWVRGVEFDKPEPTHRTNPYCASTPAANKDRVVVWHSSAGLYCYDHDGNEIWNRDLGEFRHIWGYGSSPVIHKETVFLNCGPGERTFVTAINLKDGSTKWQQDEPGGSSGLGEGSEWVGSWSTPVLVKVDGQDQLLVSLPKHVQAYDLETGAILWTVDGLGPLVYTSIVTDGKIGVAMGGFHGPAMAFRLGGQGNVTETNRLWHSDSNSGTRRNPQRIGSGVIVGKHIYVANANPPTCQCLELETGKVVWEGRLPGGEIWGSVTLVGNKLYILNPEGKTYVVAATPSKFELLATHEIGDATTNSTLVVVDGEVFLRTFEHLYCIAEKK